MISLRAGSIRRRLTVQLVGSAALLAAILYLVVQDFARDLAQQAQDSILVASVTSILDAASVRAGEISVDIPYTALSMLGTLSDDRVFYTVKIGEAVLTGYDDLPVSKTDFDASGQRFSTTEYRGEDVRFVTGTRQLSVEGRTERMLVTVAQTRDRQQAILAQITRTSLLMGLGFFVIAAILALLAAQSAVRPVNRLAEIVSRRGPDDLRPVTAPVPDEMLPLVSSLNSFISRLQTSLTRSEEFIAEAAHRVRTPLATVRTQAEVALRRVERPENRASLKDMIRAIDESSRAAGQLLDHAMVSLRADQLAQAEVEIPALIQEVVDRLGPVAELKDIDLTVDDLPKLSANGDRILLQNAVSNILDNAIKYSPRESAIHI
ncbi:MAG: two-component system sensor histidine kinase TctE, partial [Dinoroseobacter sp.]